MKERLLNQLSLTRRLRQFLVLFTLLLMPLGVWADSYFAINTSTGSHWVTDENATNILGDGTMSYDITDNVLTLDNAELAFTSDYFTDAFIAMVDQDHPSITVHLVGPSTLTLGDKASVFNGTSITFTAEDTNASLSIVTADGWTGALFLDNQSSDPINATYNSHLFLEKILENEYVIQTLICEGPASFNDGNNIVFRFGDQTACTDEQTHYSIDYVDENLQDVTNAVWVYGDADVPLLGPCTMTYYKTAGGGQSETKTAKLFGLATNSVTTTIGTSVAPPTIVPAFDHSEDLIITETQTPATGVAPVYDGTTGLISTSATGETTCSVKVDYYEASSYDYLVLNDMDDNEKYIFGDFTLTVGYALWVGGVQVTSANATNVLNDDETPTVVFDATNNKLTLNNAQITTNGNNAIQSELDNLTVFLVGEQNIITCQGETDCAFKGTGSETVTFATNPSAVGMLQIQVNTEEQLFSDITPSYLQELSLQSENSSIHNIGVFLSGEGTEESPYVISTAIELGVFATKFNDGYLESNCHVKLGADIDCTDLQDFQPIGTPERPFVGTFNGSKGDNDGNYKISNLTYDAAGESDYAGLFYVIGSDDPGSVSNLILENCTFQNGALQNGAIAGILNKGAINSCTVTSCSILSDNSWPSSGGIVGGLYGGSISNCIVNGSTITATSVTNSSAGGIVGFITGTATVSGCQVTGTNEKPTTITGSVNYYDSGNNCVGGVVGNCSDGEISISNNKVLGNTTISSIDYNGDDHTCAGAIIGNKESASLSGNTYEYTVTTSTKNGEEDAVEKIDYEQRALGQPALVEDEYKYDIVDGAMLTGLHSLTLQGLGNNCGFEGDEGYYPMADYDNRVFYFIPGKWTTFYLYPEDTFTPSVSLVYAETEGADPTDHTVTKDPEAESYVYSFEMPNAETIFKVTLSAKPSIWIGDVEVREDGTFPDYDEDVASFNSQTNTLTLNGINYGGDITSGLDELTIKVTGTSNQIGKIVSLNPAATLTFEKASAEAAASLSLSTAQMAEASSVISGFASVNYGNMYLSSSTPYQYNTTDKLLVNPTVDENNEITSATVTSATAYPLWVGSTQVTGSSVVSDKITRNGVYEGEDYGVTFTAGETNLLQLKRVGINIAESHKPAIVSGLDNLTIQLVDRNEIYFNGDYACYMVTSANENGTLTFKAAGDDALLTASIGDSQYIGSPANGFQTVNYDDNLVYIAYGTSTQYIKKLDAPSVSLSNGHLSLSSNESSADNMENLIIKYSVDYVDASLTDITNETYAEGTSPAISSPCTITAHVEYNGKIGIEATAKYFGFTEPLTITYNGTAFELTSADLPAIVPAVADGDDMTYQIDGVSEGTAVTYDQQTEKYMVQGIGTAVLDIYLMQGDNTPYQVLNEVASLTVNVVAALDVEFVGSNLWASYYSTENLNVPEGLTAYIVSAVNETTGVVTVASVDYIPADNAVLLKREQNGAANGYTAAAYTGNPATINNLLDGSEAETEISSLQGQPVYVLFNDKFKRAISGTIPARRAYLVPGTAVAPAGAPQYLTISITDDNTTAIDTLTVDDSSNDSWYSIDGLKLNGKPQRKGLYINNGKKVYINNNK